MLTIETERFVVRGKRKRRVVAISGLMEREVIPDGYFYTYPYLAGSNNIAHLHTKGLSCVLESGKVFDEKEWQQIISAIREAGERLHQLRQEEKELREEWQGTETFVI